MPLPFCNIRDRYPQDEAPCSSTLHSGGTYARLITLLCFALLTATGTGAGEDEQVKPRSEKAERVLQALLFDLTHAEAGTLMKAISLLGQYREPRAVDGLLRVLRTETPEHRSAAAKALGKIGNENYLDEIRKDIPGFSSRTRRAALSST